jgi:PAS domain S-box-containing protein
VTAACIQTINLWLVRIVEAPGARDIAPAIVAFVTSTVLVVATGGARLLLQQMAKVNRELDEQILARRAIESSLAESLTLHRNLLATLGEGVGLFDGADRFLFANAAAEKLFGLGTGKLVGRAITEFLAPESVAFLASVELKARTSRITYDLHLTGEEPRVLLVTETRMAQGPSVESKTLRVLRDMTARAKLEQERRELDLYLQRTEALQSLAVLAGGVAHDFNNLLSGVIGSAELGLLRLVKSPASARQCLEDARRYAVEASDLSRKMLAYAGKRSVSVEVVSLAEEVSESLKLVTSAIAGKAYLRNEIPNGLPAIRVDRTGLHQVVTNLVLNAIEAMEGTKRRNLVLDAWTTHVASTDTVSREPLAPPTGSYVVLSVADAGEGMTTETRARLFEPFFSTKFQGRGMGLAATLGIVRAHRGGITVESELGVGTTFRVYWPMAKNEQPSEPVASGPLLLERRDVTVLLVDDELVVREVTSSLLTEMGCKVHLAASGREALVFFGQAFREVDLVMLDLTMPDQSGLEVLEAMRDIDPEVRVVLTSGYSVHDSVEPFQQPGVIGFLPKPHHVSALEKVIHRVLPNGQRGLSGQRVSHAEPTTDRLGKSQS